MKKNGELEALCAECSKVIEADEVVQGQHPIAQWVYACHRLLAGRISVGKPSTATLVGSNRQFPNVQVGSDIA